MPNFFSALFIILVSLTMTLFSKVLISNRCISGLMSNLIKTSWADSILGAFLRYPFLRTLSWGPFHGGNFSYLFLYISRLEIIVKWHLRRIDLQVPLFTKFRPTMKIQGKMGICPTALPTWIPKKCLLKLTILQGKSKANDVWIMSPIEEFIIWKFGQAIGGHRTGKFFTNYCPNMSKNVLKGSKRS